MDTVGKGLLLIIASISHIKVRRLSSLIVCSVKMAVSIFQIVLICLSHTPPK